jgi:Ca2+:H+ antiporter
MFFGSLNDGDAALGLEDRNPVNDDIRGDLLKVSRGMSFILLAVYICSRFFLHIPLAGEENEEEKKGEEKGKEKEHTQKEEEEEEEEPEMNLWVCIVSLLVTLGLLAVTAQFVSLAQLMLICT